MVHGNGPNFATLVRLSWPFQRGSTVVVPPQNRSTSVNVLAPGTSNTNFTWSIHKNTLYHDVLLEITMTTTPTRVCFLSPAWSNLRLCSPNHRPAYWSNLPCDWPNTAWAYFEQETEKGPWSTAEHAECLGKTLLVWLSWWLKLFIESCDSNTL